MGRCAPPASFSTDLHLLEDLLVSFCGICSFYELQLSAWCVVLRGSPVLARPAPGAPRLAPEAAALQPKGKAGTEPCCSHCTAMLTLQCTRWGSDGRGLNLYLSHEHALRRLRRLALRRLALRRLVLGARLGRLVLGLGHKRS